MLAIEVDLNDAVLIETPLGQMTVRVAKVRGGTRVKLVFDGDRSVFTIVRQAVLMKRQKERAEAAAAASAAAGPRSPGV